MSISLADLPKDNSGALPGGTWHVTMKTPLNERFGMVWFRDGSTVEPIDGRRLRRLVAAMGNGVLRAVRVEDGLTIGDAPDDVPDVPATEPAPEPEPETPPAADELPFSAPDERSPAPEPPSESEPPRASARAVLAAGLLDVFTRDELKAFVRENGLTDEVDLRASADDLRLQLKTLLETLAE